MMGTTVAIAAAANYPMPFVSGSTADVAVVVGDNATADLTAAATLSADLSTRFAASGGHVTQTQVDPDRSFPLFTSSSQLFLNNTVNAVRTTVTDADLPSVLAEGTFDGVSGLSSSSTQFTHKIVIGDNPVITFAKMPTSSDDPSIGVSFSTNPSTTPLYNATITFDQNVNFTHADSIGEDINLFGQKFTVGAGTSTNKLVLLKSSQTVDLASDTNPSASVTVEGEAYTVELVAATDTSATIKVTKSDGSSDTKEISESSSKTIKGVEVSVDRADENNFRLTATVSVGSNRLTLQDGTALKTGSDEDTIDGTQVEFYLANGTGTSYPGAIGRIDVQVAAPDSDKDAIFPGNAFVDPVFGTFKFDFTGISTPADDTSDRELIKVQSSGNDKMEVTFADHSRNEKTISFVYNKTTVEGVTPGSGLGGMILADSDGDPIRVVELTMANKSQYVVVPNDRDGGGLYEVTFIYNNSDTATDDYVRLKNVFSGDEKEYKASTEGSLTATLEGKTATISYWGSASSAQEVRQIRLNTPESSSGTQIVMFPTIKTAKGAKVAFYQPTRLNLSMVNFGGAIANNVTSLAFPDGDGYTTVAVANGLGSQNENWTFGGTVLNASNPNAGVTATIGKLIYNITGAGTAAGGGSDSVNVYLTSPDGGNIVRPALVVFEERDDLTNYEASIVTMDAGYDGNTNDIGVNDIVRTYGADSASLGNEIQLESNRDLYQDMDFWGSLYTLDKSDTDQVAAEISYPDDQVTAKVYVAEADASSGGSTGGALGDIVYDASEVSSVSNKNLIVLGGSCINTVASQLLGGSAPICGADFTAKTQVGTGSFLIQSFTSPWNSNKIALLVAGYEATDTMNAANALKSNTVDTTVGKKYKGTTATSLTPLL